MLSQLFWWCWGFYTFFDQDLDIPLAKSPRTCLLRISSLCQQSLFMILPDKNQYHHYPRLPTYQRGPDFPKEAAVSLKEAGRHHVPFSLLDLRMPILRLEASPPQNAIAYVSLTLLSYCIQKMIFLIFLSCSIRVSLSSCMFYAC